MLSFLVLSFCLCLAVPPQNASGFQGGPDGFGYYWESTQDCGDTITFSWLDPSTHQPIVGWFPNPDDGWVRIGLPFQFPFYGDTLDSVVVCSNGFLEFPTTFTTYENRSLPAPEFPYLLALYWDDLSPARSGSVRRYDDPALGFTCITWFNVVRFNSWDTLSAQVLLFADGSIRMNILRATRTKDSNTVGIQGHSGGNDHCLQYVHDGLPTKHQPEDSMSVRFYVRRLAHDVGVFRAGTPLGWIPTGCQSPVTGVFKNYGLGTETFPVTCRIVRTRVPRDTVFARTRLITGLVPGDTSLCYFGDWLVPPSPDSWFVLLETRLSGDLLPRNDTACFVTSSFPPGFGAVLGTWDFPEIGSGMNLTGITYCQDLNRFYVTSTQPNQVYSFPACSSAPRLEPEAFELQDFFGGDVVWGIAWDQTGTKFWITHVPLCGPGCVVAGYGLDGLFTSDTWNLELLAPDAWFAGLDAGRPGTLFAVEVGGLNRILELDVANHRIVRALANPTSSFRACSFLGDNRSYLITGGWNQGALIELDLGGLVTRTAPLADLADLDIYRPENPSPDSIVWAYATLSRLQNTICKLSLGRTWRAVGISADAPRSALRGSNTLGPSIIRSGQTIVLSDLPTGAAVCLWDVSGRQVTQRQYQNCGPCVLGSDFTSLPAGIYVLTISTVTTKLSSKLVVTAP